jgi:hypothetical protein
MLWRVFNRKSHQFHLGLLKIFSIEQKKTQHIYVISIFLEDESVIAHARRRPFGLWQKPGEESEIMW